MIMSSILFGSPLSFKPYGSNQVSNINKKNMDSSRDCSTINQDPDKVKLILDEMYRYSKKEIIKIEKNLDVIYGAFSVEKKNGLNQLHEHLKNKLTIFFNDVVFESNRDKHNIIKDIEELLAEKAVLEKELQIKIEFDEHNDNNPLIDVQISIDKALIECRKIKQDRMTKLNKLQEEEKKICKLLNEKPKYSGIKDMPSATQLLIINNYVIDLKRTQVKHRFRFLNQKTKVESLFRALEEIPILPFDKLVMGDPNNFQLSKSNLDKLQNLIIRLEYQTENQKCITMELRTKLNSLWDRLQIDVTYRENFVSNKKGFGNTIINELKKEVERCEILKKENIKQFILKLRDELNDLWDQCHFGERQRRQCNAYYNTEFNEDLMDILDIEVDNVKKLYNDNISIYNLIEDRERLWNKMKMMQEQTNNPARLWKNRGGQLLKEEKERKVIKKELPRIEKELKNLLQSFEETEGKSFLYNDERLLDIIHRQWEEMKSNNKSVQQIKSKIQTGKVQTPQRAAFSSKKKIAPTSSNQPTKITSRQLFNTAIGPLISTKLNEINVTTANHAILHGSNDENASVESYETFQEHLESKMHILYSSPTRKPIMKTPIKGSQIPVPTTPRIPIYITPKRALDTRMVKKIL